MVDVESLTASLVREYLSRKGLKNALKVMDQELPRGDDSISNRAQLAKEVHIEKLMKKNKEQSSAHRTMLEVIVQYLKEKGGSITTSTTAVRPAAPEPAPTEQHLTQIKERKSSREKTRKTETQAETTEQISETPDYSDLLRRLEKSEAPPKRTEIPKLRDHGLHKSHQNSKLSSDIQVAGSISEKASRPKSTRGRTRSSGGLGGPIISSGLAGLGDKRLKHKRNQTSDLNITGHSFHIDEAKDNQPDFHGIDVTKPTDAFKSEGFFASKHGEKVMKDTALDFPNDDLTDASSIHRQTSSGTSRKSSRDRRTLSTGSGAGQDELVFEDVDDDLDDDLGQLALGPSKAIAADFESKSISLEQAMALKNLLFGTATSSFNPEWRQQGFGFCDLYGLEFGVVQFKGGPCGVLAAVQGFILKYLLFEESKKRNDKKNLQPSSRERTKALVSALTEILWRAGESREATVALPIGMGNSNFIGAGRYKPDQLTENLVIRTFKSHESLHSYIGQQISQFEGDGRSGCILLLYSAILSRTIKKVISDMDEPTNKLMGAHGYCTQEMVNLLMTGRSVSNVFDNVIELDSGGASKMRLKGIDKQAEIGLLSLFEHYGSCQVGVNYKTPRLPIWVVCSESHFSVLFSTQQDLLDNWRLNKKFDLNYYDGLARQDEEIRLTVDTTQECPEYDDGDLVPPLELVIRTKWKKATIGWNGSEPIL